MDWKRMCSWETISAAPTSRGLGEPKRVMRMCGERTGSGWRGWLHERPVYGETGAICFARVANVNCLAGVVWLAAATKSSSELIGTTDESTSISIATNLVEL